MLYIVKYKKMLIVAAIILLMLLNLLMFFASFKLRPKNDWGPNTYIGKVISLQNNTVSVENRQKVTKTFIVKQPLLEVATDSFVIVKTVAPMKPGENQNIEAESIQLFKNKK